MNLARRVAQISNLLYRRFPIGKATNLLARIMVRIVCRLEALRYSRLELCATSFTAILLSFLRLPLTARVSDFDLRPSDLMRRAGARRPFGTFLGFAFLILICATQVRAQTPSSDFEIANKLYYEAQFTNAASAYEKLIQSGQHAPSIYFNLGNAWFKSGQIGRAIAAYRHAEQLTPRDPDVRANLRFARNQAQGPSYAPNAWQRWVGKLTLNEWTLLATGSVWIWFLMLAALQSRPQWKNSLRSLSFALAAVSLVLCGCLAAAVHEDRGFQTAVVIAREAIVRHGPLEESQNSFAVHDGAELRVLDRKDDWLLVTTDPRRIGWLRRDQVLLASP